MSTIGCCITDRDEQLLRFLLSQGQATAAQLVERFFPSLGAFYRRISALQKMGLIETRRALDCAKATPGGVLDFMKAIKVRRRQIDKMKIYRASKGVRKHWPRADGRHCTDQIMKHQLLLTEVRGCIERHLEGKEYTVLNDAESLLESTFWGGRVSNDTPVPDLVFRGKDINIAIELERSHKSETEYMLRMSQYKLYHYTHIIYFCATEGIHKRVKKIASMYPTLAVGTTWDQERVFHDRCLIGLGDFLRGNYGRCN